MLPAEMSALSANPLCRSVVDLQPTAFPLAGQPLNSRPPMVFLSVRCLPRSSDLLERVGTTSEQFAQRERCP